MMSAPSLTLNRTHKKNLFSIEVNMVCNCLMKVWFLKYIFKVLNWVKTFVREKVLLNVNHVKRMLSLLFTLEIRCKGTSQLYDHIAMQLGGLMGTVDVSPQSVTLIAVHSASAFYTGHSKYCDILHVTDWSQVLCR